MAAIYRDERALDEIGRHLRDPKVEDGGPFPSSPQLGR